MKHWFEKLAEWIESRNGCRYIYRNGPDGKPELYLKRYYIFKHPKIGEVVLHQFFQSDSGNYLHDHPWMSFGWILSRGYFEHTINPDEEFRTTNPTVRKFCAPGHFGFRGKHDFHKVELPSDAIGKGKVWTLFCTGRRKREWGYLVDNIWMSFKEIHRKLGIDTVEQFPYQFSNGLFPRNMSS